MEAPGPIAADPIIPAEVVLNAEQFQWLLISSGLIIALLFALVIVAIGRR